MSTINGLIERQQELFTSISRTIINLKKKGEANITETYVKARLTALTDNWAAFQQNHVLISDQKTEAIRKTSYFSEDLRTQCEEMVIENQAILNEYLARLAPAAQSSTSSDSHLLAPGERSVNQSRSLLQLGLPKFSGVYKEWTPFRDLFQSMVVANQSIPEVEKFHYLKMSVTGEAAQLISNLSVTVENFKLAWHVLSDRYENRRVLVNTQLELLFSLKRIQRESATELKRLHGTTNEVLGALNGLKCDTKNWDPIIVYWVSRKFDPATLKEWELHTSDSTEILTLTQLNEFLVRHIRATEAMERVGGSSPSTPRPRDGKVQVHQASVAAIVCPACNASHLLQACPTYLAKTLEQRKAFAMQQRLCVNCLGAHHRKSCRSTKRCVTCKGRHHSTLHEASKPVATPNPPTRSREELPSSPEPSVAPATSHLVSNSANFLCASRRMLLATALVRVSSPRGEVCVVRALLDQGSEISFATESLVQQLSLPRRQATVPVSGIGAGRTVVSRGASTFQLSSLIEPTFSLKVNALILPKLTDYTVDRYVRVADLPHLHGIQLADPNPANPKRIDLILGVDVYNSVLLPDVIRGPPRTAIAQRTQLGWIVSGPAPHLSGEAPLESPSSLQCCVDRELVDLLQRFWTQEEYVTNRESQLSEDDLQCEQHFVKTHSRDHTGRFIVRLPLSRDASMLGDSRSSEYRILISSERRLAKNPTLRHAYTQFLNEYENLGHMRHVSSRDIVTSIPYYLPHHGVFRDSASTKIRVVFNGSHKTSTGYSLNDCLHSGPKLQNDLADILLRWRQYQFAFSADVEKMYRQIRVHPDDQSLQRILWRRDSASPVLEFALTTVTYGLACSPYLALRCMRQLAVEYTEELPCACTIILDEMYVDDVLSGAHSVEEGQAKVTQIIRLLEKGGFRLHKWTANTDQLLSNLCRAVDSPTERSLNPDSSHRALGLSWNITRDAFIFSFCVSDHSPITKRTVLSTVSQLFDPLGWIAPVIVNGKILMQELWTLQVGWDDPLPSAFVKRWEGFKSSLPELRALSIPRWIRITPTNIATEIHGFADASSLAMGIAVYLRTRDEDDEIHTSLLLAKTKVAPLKRVTIPRLELSAAVLLTRFVVRVRRVLHLDHVPVHLWSDSAVALAWIRSHPSRWKEYVQNRVSEIQTSLPEASWRHVPGTQNPADLASRGASPQHLAGDRMWWEGPEWLRLPSPAWPSNELPVDAQIDVEMRQVRTHAALLTSDQPWINIIARFSSLSRLCRVTAWVFRAVDKFRTRLPPPFASPTLRVAELDRARLYWVRETQKEYFQDELSALSTGSTVAKSSPTCKLMPYVDEHGHLRVGGRLNNAMLHPDQKHPLILPRSSTLTSLVIDHAHKLTLHAGPQLTLATVRQSYWILGGRCPIRAFINKCTVCVRQQARTAEQMMGQLPARRVTPSRAFLHSGVDYAGPFCVKTTRGRGGKILKGYIALFVCFATGAIHLELVSDYSADAFIAAYKRFSGRRGIPATITSDCGTNLVGADRELRNMLSKASSTSSAIANSLANDGTEWKFNPPSAPHFGGKWEASVKSVKFHIRRVVGNTALTFEEFSTLLAQVEAVLNSRPLCPLTDDPSDLGALTPGHFLTGDTLKAVPEPNLADVPTSRLSRWQLLRHFVDRIWARWSSEYLSSIQSATKWLSRCDNVKVGSLVLVKDERLPPSKWPLARVTQLHPGRDNLTRVVTVRTASTSLTRPITKLCILPVDVPNTGSAHATTGPSAIAV